MTKAEALMHLKAWQSMIDPLNADHKLDTRFAALEIACVALEIAIEQEKKDVASNTTYKARLARAEYDIRKLEERVKELEKTRC